MWTQQDQPRSSEKFLRTCDVVVDASSNKNNQNSRCSFAFFPGFAVSTGTFEGLGTCLGDDGEPRGGDGGHCHGEQSAAHAAWTVRSGREEDGVEDVEVHVMVVAARLLVRLGHDGADVQRLPVPT